MDQNQSAFTVLIIGAGKIAAGYDNKTDARVLTHAHAISINRELSLLGFMDINPEISFKATQKWGGHSFESFSELDKLNPDIIVVCVPDGVHDSILKVVLDRLQPKLVICEKPITDHIDTSITIVREFQKRRIPLLINYQRRYDTTFEEIRRNFHGRKYGKLLSGTLKYSKGIMHNGSHGIDVFRYLFGEPHSFIISDRIFDYRSNDPSVSGILFFKNCSIHILASDERIFSIFEIDLIFEKIRYRITQSGINVEVSHVKEDPVYPGYQELIPRESKETGLSFALSRLYNDVINSLKTSHFNHLRVSAEYIIGTQFCCSELATAPLHHYQSFSGSAVGDINSKTNLELETYPS